MCSLRLGFLVIGLLLLSCSDAPAFAADDVDGDQIYELVRIVRASTEFPVRLAAIDRLAKASSTSQPAAVAALTMMLDERILPRRPEDQHEFVLHLVHAFGHIGPNAIPAEPVLDSLARSYDVQDSRIARAIKCAKFSIHGSKDELLKFAQQNRDAVMDDLLHGVSLEMLPILQPLISDSIGTNRTGFAIKIAKRAAMDDTDEYVQKVKTLSEQRGRFQDIAKVELDRIRQLKANAESSDAK